MKTSHSNYRSALPLAALVALALCSCDARFADGKYRCEVPSNCPGSSFHYCRPSSGNAGPKLCFQTAGSPETLGNATGSKPDNPPAHNEEGPAGAMGAPKTDDGGHSGSAGEAGSGGQSGGSSPVDPNAGAPKPSNTTPHAMNGGMSGAGHATAGNAGADAQPGTTTGFGVTRSEPTDGELMHDPTSALVVQFSEPVDGGSVTSATFRVAANPTPPATQQTVPVTGKLTVSADGSSAQFVPEPRWQLGGHYLVQLHSSIFSRTQQALPETELRFSVRSGKWNTERVATPEVNDQLESPTIAVSDTGYVALSWDTAHTTRRSYSVQTRRREQDGTWTALADLDTSARSPAVTQRLLAMFDSGTVVFGRQPQSPGDTWLLQCVDAKGVASSVGVSGIEDSMRSIIADMATTTDNENYALYILQGAPYNSTQSLVPSVAATRCNMSDAPTIWQLPMSVGNNTTDFTFVAGGTVVWLDHAAWMADAGPEASPTRLWGLRGRGSPVCEDPNSCPTLLSAADAVADSPDIVATALVYRQFANDTPSIWARALDDSPSGWGPAQRISTLPGSAHSPRVAVLPNGRALSVWVQSAPKGAQVMSAVFDSKSWSVPTAISQPFMEPAMDASTTPALAVDSSGNGMVVWPQPLEADPTQHDIHAVPFVADHGWQPAMDQVVSRNHAAGYAVSVGMDRYGRAFAAWKEADSIWVGRWE